MTAEIKINVYQDGGEWFGARWVDGEYDGCDPLPVDGDASDDDAIQSAETVPLTIPGARIVTRVSDMA